MPRARIVALWVITAIGLAVTFSVEPIAQDPSYHRFADARALFGIPNFWNVLSNFPFLLVGLFGLATISRRQRNVDASAYVLFCIGALGVGVGSGYYHLAPTNATLVWDRLPMTIAFMALFSCILADRIDAKVGRLALWPLIVAGLSSVVYWHWTELAGRGDLRPYALVQFLPMLLIPILLLAFPGRGMRASWIWLTLAGYVLAKLAEHFDAPIMQVLDGISGHSLKHLFAAIAIVFAIVSMRSALEPVADRARPSSAVC